MPEMGSPDLLPGREFFGHGAPGFNELNYHIRIDAMTTEEKLDWVSRHVLKEEERLLRIPLNLPPARPEAKIIFLTGGPKDDVTEARDFEGNLIHTRHLDHPRPMFAEIPEAQNAIHHWFDLLIQSKDQNTAPPSPVSPLAEVADVVYNVSQLITLDQSFAENYRLYLERIAGSLGFSLDQLLTLAIYKFNFRLGQGKSQKNVPVENNILERVLSQKGPDGKPLYPSPSERQFQKTYHTLAEVRVLLNTRMQQLEQDYEWKKDQMGT